MTTQRPIRTRTGVVLGVAVVALTAAGCGDGDDQTAGTGSDGIVSTQEVDGHGTILADADGNAMYINEAEADGSVKCVDACLDFWPPLIVDAEGSVPGSVDGIDGEFGSVTRDDGSIQLTLDSMPLYTFAEDQGPGSVTGDGAEDDFQGSHFVWHVVTGDDSAPADDEDDDGGRYGY